MQLCWHLTRNNIKVQSSSKLIDNANILEMGHEQKPSIRTKGESRLKCTKNSVYKKCQTILPAIVLGIAFIEIDTIFPVVSVNLVSLTA